MKKIAIITAYLITVSLSSLKAQMTSGPMHEKFSVKVLTDKLSDPWEITYGPDKFLWMTEARGYKVSRINPITGTKTVLLDLNKYRNFPRYDKLPKEVSGGKPWPQGGLMGMALHPQLLSGKPYVYLAYVYRFAGANDTDNGCALNNGGCFFTTKIVRYEYSATRQKLFNPILLCDTLPGSSDHNGGRLLIAPVDGKDYLFYSIGDLGAGQFTNGGRPNHAQDKQVYEGKILRFNLAEDKDAHSLDKWIPNDNPFNGKRQNAVWSYGHRNPQGLSYAVVNGVGRIYSSEHGPFSDDEVNIIEKGKNYGHPLVIGYADNNYNGLAAGVSDKDFLPGPWNTTYPLIKDEQENARKMGDAYRDPIKTLYPNSNSFLTELFNKIKNGEEGDEWPSEAPSSMEVYTADAIPGWKNSLLIPVLKGNKLIRLKLNESGNQITGDTLTYFKGDVRYRDMAVSPDGKKFYMAVDSTSVSSGPSKENPQSTSYRGCILEFTYEGQDNNRAAQENKSAYLAPAQRKRNSK